MRIWKLYKRPFYTFNRTRRSRVGGYIVPPPCSNYIPQDVKLTRDTTLPLCWGMLYQNCPDNLRPSHLRFRLLFS
jgi:hypothetical protein